MFILLKNNKIIDSNEFLYPLINRIGFINEKQYYHHKKNNTKKFSHLNHYEILNINQSLFFQENLMI